MIVIGAGQGGYACAIRAAQLGLRTACIDERETLGGTCLNVGCIPSKALLHATYIYDAAANGTWSRFGIRAESLSFDLAAMMAQKDEIVRGLTRGIEFLFRKNKVERIQGSAAFEDAHTIMVADKRLTARHVIIATGSVPAPFRSARIDNDAGIIVDSTGALALKSVPERLIVIGGGVIGLELGSVWARLGSNVTILEYQDAILPGMDGDIRKTMQQLLQAQGMQIKTAVEVQTIEQAGRTAIVTCRQNGESKSMEADTVLVATGRRPNTAGLHLKKIGLVPDERGFIPVDHTWKTQIDGVYAIGDVTNGPMLAHRAEDEGIALAERLAGIVRDVNHAVIPAVVYTHPEVATVGETEETVRQSGRPYKVSKFPMLANSRAKANGESEGFVKLIAHEKTDIVLGAHVIASVAGTMIAQIAQAMEFGATAEDIAYTCHAHPTHGEAIKEAALGLDGSPIHI